MNNVNNSWSQNTITKLISENRQNYKDLYFCKKIPYNIVEKKKINFFLIMNLRIKKL